MNADSQTASSDPMQAIWALLKKIPDPEVPALSITDLGMVRGVRLDGDAVEVAFTPTYSGCPATDQISDDIRHCLTDAGFSEVRVVQQLAPVWTTDWMSSDARERLRQFGIAPPQGKACLGADPAPEGVACPRCGSTDSRLVSEFGSTACKAHYTCRSCLEPFDYFKCI